MTKPIRDDGSGDLAYQWVRTDDSFEIVEHENGTFGDAWSWAHDQEDIARAFWGGLQSAIMKRGDLRAIFVEPGTKLTIAKKKKLPKTTAKDENCWCSGEGLVFDNGVKRFDGSRWAWLCPYCRPRLR